MTTLIADVAANYFTLRELAVGSNQKDLIRLDFEDTETTANQYRGF